MSQIALLPEPVVGQIAAGEVVERPAAAVKELVENALDAGAHRITISLAAGGLDRMEVVDDGVGIAAKELPLALARHATSKLQTADDLYRLHTYGFRGEALPAIAAVSEFTLASRPAADDIGAEIEVSGGAIGMVRPVGMAVGTRAVAAHLFENVPARREFAKSPAAEAAATFDLMRKLALSQPGVAFEVLRDGGRTVIRTAGDGNLDAALKAVYGDALAEDLVAVGPMRGALEGGGTVEVAGRVSPPSQARATRGHQTFLVNGRVVESQGIRYALESAYRGRLLRGRYPAAVLRITVSPAQVDVNVHPQKREVRFKDAHAVEALVHRAVAHALDRTVIAARADLTGQLGAPFVTEFEAGRIPRSVEAIPPQRLYPWPTVPFGAPVPHPPAPRVAERAAKLPEPAEELDAAPEISMWERAHVLRQLRQLYILAEDEGALYLIDQHAAAERVLYEQLAHDALSRQSLIAPVTLEVGAAAVEAVQDHGKELEALGYVVQPFGESAVLLREIPAGAHQAQAGLQDLLETYGAKRRAGAEADHARRALVACHAAVRRGDALSEAEMAHILKTLGQCDHPFQCPHGRPTVRRLAWTEIDAFFRRRD